MPDQLLTIVPTVLTAAIAALVTFLLANVNEFIRDRRAHRRRWDKDTFERILSFIDAARHLHHLSADGRSAPASLEESVGQIRIEGAKLRILAGGVLAERTLEVQRHAYAVTKMANEGVDPRPSDRSPRHRLLDAIESFSVAARSQLGLGDTIHRLRD